MTPGGRCERTAMEGAGQRSGGMAIVACDGRLPGQPKEGKMSFSFPYCAETLGLLSGGPDQPTVRIAS